MKLRRERLHQYGNSNRRSLLLGSSLPPNQARHKRTCLRSLIGRKALQTLNPNPKIPGPKRPRPEIREFTTRNLKEIWRRQGKKEKVKKRRKEWENRENSQLRGGWGLQNAWNRDAKIVENMEHQSLERYHSGY